ncbi:hypothetical protein [Micromonospora auratinigra]|uniref:Uncharacterized protein n=1 Tax=Micromonospora auratinigra TaxID=261654 RepID=A0A1A8ZJ50_9ACTN|nr:hypothetical protein [Micromonospora auratinigra]SBT43912.1 hypothetical protein GA0070611_2503 [Micromonospora auratinigra]
MVAAVTRHLVGMAVAWSVVVAEAVVGYLALLGYAVATDSDPGGMFAGPVLVLVAAMYGVLLQPLLFLPAVVVAETAGRRRGTGRVLAVTAAVAATLAVGYAIAGSVASDAPAGEAAAVAAIAALLVLPPALAYAVAARGVRWTARRWARRRDAATALIETEAG